MCGDDMIMMMIGLDQATAAAYATAAPTTPSPPTKSEIRNQKVNV